MKWHVVGLIPRTWLKLILSNTTGDIESRLIRFIDWRCTSRWDQVSGFWLGLIYPIVRWRMELQVGPHNWTFFSGVMADRNICPQILVVFDEGELTLMDQSLMLPHSSWSSLLFVKEEDSRELEQVASGTRVSNIFL